MKALLLCLGLGFAAQTAKAQNVLPQGVGLYRFGYRGFAAQSDKFGEDGSRLSLGAPFQKDFDGQGLLAGNGGKDLSRLAEELKRYDGTSGRKDSLVNQLHLGSLSGNVEANINAKVFALGYGLFPRFTVYAGVPYVHARVKSSLQFDGENNAAKIKQQLGGAAYQELQDGLDRASKLTVLDVEQSIADKGYAPVGEWERDGLGDVQLGGVWLIAQQRQGPGLFSMTLDSALSLPTGYVESPDILTDVSFGQGTYAITEKVTPSWQWQYFSLGGEALANIPLPGNKDVRLPENDETLTESDRKTTVHFAPGQTFQLAVDFGARWQSLRSVTRIGYKTKMIDQYSGSKAGNYAKLAKGSDSQQTFTELGLGLDTTNLYAQKRFPIPMLINTTVHLPMSGRNTNDDRYYELSLTSFFQIPGAGRDAKLERPTRKSPRTASNY